MRVAANHSVAANTWPSYATAERHIARAEKVTGVNITFPFSLKSLLAYVGFLLAPKVDGGRGLQGKSVEEYLSAIRLLHMQKGFFEPYISPEIIKQITRGAVIRDQVAKRMEGKAEKMAMTVELMYKLKISLDAVTELIFVTNIMNYIRGEKNCHVEKFQLSILNLNN